MTNEYFFLKLKTGEKMEVTYHLDYRFFDNPLNFDNLNLYQIGRMYCVACQEIGEHIHRDFFELTIVTEGEGMIFTGKVGTKVKRGDIYLSLPCDTHKIVSSKENPLKFDFIAFGEVAQPFGGELEKICEQYHFPDIRVFHSEQIVSLVASAIAEIKKEKPFSAELLPLLFKEMLIHLIRAFQNIKPEKSTLAATQAEVLCYKLMNYIDTHIYSMKTLEELSTITDYSYGYLSTLFKKTTGNTLSYYYREKKINAARLMLLENRFKITEISDMLGYASVYAFSKAFTTRYGISPRTYRQENLK